MEVEAKRIARAYDKYKSALTSREKDVLTKYYGIDDQVRHTLAELGRIFQVTKERIRQIKVIALNKIKINK